MNDLTQLSVTELRNLIRSREVSVSEVVDSFLDRVAEMDSRLKAFVTVDEDGIRKSADQLDKALSANSARSGALTGVPIAVKDNIVTSGLRTTCASRILGNWVPPYDATVVGKLRAAGGLLLGKTNLDEFAMGSSTENSAHFPTRNPVDLERVPGGSSGGSACAVASRLAPGGLGSDTGGSIRQPAAFCGTVGLKPTYGRVSRYGLVAFGSSLDQIGPLANSVEDVALLLGVIAGKDDRDSTSADHTIDDYAAEIGKDISGLRVGIPVEWLSSGLDAGIEKAVRKSINELEKLGCHVQEVRLPHTAEAIAVYYIIAPAEASSNLARYDGVKYGYRSSRHRDLEEMYRNTRTEGFGEEVKRRIMIGTYVLSSGYYDAYYLKASKVRTLIKMDYVSAFDEVDLLVGPTTPTPPFKLGEKTADPLRMYLSDVYTVTANLAGIPALSMPCGFDDQGLPVGLQILGPHFGEGRILRLAYALEQELSLRPAKLAI